AVLVDGRSAREPEQGFNIEAWCLVEHHRRLSEKLAAAGLLELVRGTKGPVNEVRRLDLSERWIPFQFVERQLGEDLLVVVAAEPCSFDTFAKTLKVGDHADAPLNPQLQVTITAACPTPTHRRTDRHPPPQLATPHGEPTSPCQQGDADGPAGSAAWRRSPGASACRAPPGRPAPACALPGRRTPPGHRRGWCP